MMIKTAKEILNLYKNGSITEEDAERALREENVAELGFAQIDLARKKRRGTTEVIYGASKTPEQILKIAQTLVERGQSPVLITRMNAEAAKYVKASLALTYYPTSKIGVIGDFPAVSGKGKIAIVSAGTSDQFVTEEAELTAKFLGNEVVCVQDVGVAGLHRLVAKIDVIRSARVVIAVAGMEGALASVVAGLIDAPVIAVPTSVGYGASFGGLTALLAMINSCAAGVSVVNIDNGFGAAYLASQINHLS